MSLLNFAVASIVDANTGNGFNRQFVDQFGSKSTPYEQHGHEIRARSILTLLAKIKASALIYIESSRTAARERQIARQISELSHHLLKDIGLTQVDAYDLRSGLISLDSLNARREPNLEEQQAGLTPFSHSPEPVISSRDNLESDNEIGYELKKCA
jgi:uncharacterized protein YjiS (DUF1127 family)